MEKVNNNENKEKANDNGNTQINSETKKPELLASLRNAEKEEEEEFDQMIQQLREKREEKLKYYRSYLTLGRILWDIGVISTIYGAFSSYIAGLTDAVHHLSPSHNLFEVWFAIWIAGLVMALLGRIIRENADDWP
ncbi:MAG: hypothetical protein RXO35_02400 [Candidatus Micrarchaeota archaeon]